MTRIELENRKLAASKGHSVIDVTLRDGGFRNDFSWSPEVAHGVIEGAFASGAEYCELGYVGGLPDLHNAGVASPFAMLTAKRIEDLVANLRTDWVDRAFAVMRHPTGRAPMPSPDELLEVGVQLIRFVYHPSWADQLAIEHASAKEAGLKTTVNLAIASRYTSDELKHHVSIAEGLCPDILYFADTCGALTPDELPKLVRMASKDFEVGFHGHDYLSLAIANSLAAVDAGAKWIDTSIWGLGRGAGNARTEVWSALRYRNSQVKLIPEQLAESMRWLESNLDSPKLPDWVAVICGAANLIPPEEDEIRRSAEPHIEAAKIFTRDRARNAQLLKQP